MGESRGFYEDARRNVYQFGHGQESNFSGRGPKGYRRSDERIAEEVSEALARHPDIDASDIEVRVERASTAERLSELGRVEKLNAAFRIYPKDKSRAAQLAQEVVELVNLHGWKVEGMYSERGELDEVFRPITLPDTVKK